MVISSTIFPAPCANAEKYHAWLWRMASYGSSFDGLEEQKLLINYMVTRYPRIRKE